MWICAAALHTGDSLVFCWREKKVAYFLIELVIFVFFGGGANILVKCVCNNYGYLSIKIPFHDGACIL